jgi:hypothetical protein
MKHHRSTTSIILVFNPKRRIINLDVSFGIHDKFIKSKDENRSNNLNRFSESQVMNDYIKIQQAI